MKISIVDNWRDFWKMQSLYVFAFFALLPDIWELVVASGLLELTPIGPDLELVLRVAGLIGAIVRLLKIQVKLMRETQKLDPET